MKAENVFVQGNQDAYAVLQDLLDRYEGKTGLSVTVQAGEYTHAAQEAVRDYTSLLYGDLDYDTPWGRENIPFHKALEARHITDLTLDFGGATLWMQGLVQPFSFIGCCDVQVKNLTVNWIKPPFLVGEIVAIQDSRVTLQIQAGFEASGGEAVWALYDVDKTTGHVCTVYKFRGMSPLKLEGEGRVSFDVGTTAQRLHAGMRLILRHVGNYRPAFHLLDCQNVSLEDVTIHAAPGMGVIAHRCRDVRFRRFAVSPYEDRLMSTNTDATHFISCSGLIDFEDCAFSGMGDDAINVHGFYLAVSKVLDAHTVLCQSLRADGTQDQCIDAPNEGQEVGVYHAGNQCAFASGTVKQVRIDAATWEVTLQFESPLAGLVTPGDMLTQISDLAALRVINCHMHHLRARALLLQTHDVWVENCLIEHCSGSGIHITSDIQEGWYESIGAKNVVLRGNTIRHCGYGDGTYRGTSGIVIESGETDTTVGVHRDIVLESNVIVADGAVGIFIANSENVRVQGNEIRGSGQDAVQVQHARQVVLANNVLHGGQVNVRME